VCGDWHRHAKARRLRCVGVDTESDVDGEEIFEESCRRSLVRTTGPDDAKSVSESGRKAAPLGDGPFGERDTALSSSSSYVS